MNITLTTEELWSTYHGQIIIGSAAHAAIGHSTMSDDDLNEMASNHMLRAEGLLMALGYDLTEAARLVDEAFVVAVARAQHLRETTPDF